MRFWRKLLLSAIFSVVVVPGVLAQGRSTRDEAVQAFGSGNYQKAIDLLKTVTSQNKADSEAWVLLGTSYYRLNQFKDAAKAYEKAVDADPKNEVARTNLATAYLLTNKGKGSDIARDILKTDPRNAMANFVFGVYEYRRQKYSSAYDHATAAVQLDPKIVDGYLLVYQSLVATLVDRKGEAVESATRAEVMTKAVAAFKKYYDLLPADQQKLNERQFSDLKFFEEYYSRPDVKQPVDADQPAVPEPGHEPLKILTKPKASFTDEARSRGVNGTILLMVGFNANGRIGPVMLLKSLEKDLDQNAISAARAITFVPEKKNGVPVSVVKLVEYTFTYY